MRHKTKASPDYVFDSLSYDHYRSGGTNYQELKSKLDLVYRAMDKELSPIQLRIFEEYYLNGRKMKDIAADLGIHPSTVTRHIRRARDKIAHIASYY